MNTLGLRSALVAAVGSLYSFGGCSPPQPQSPPLARRSVVALQIPASGWLDKQGQAPGLVADATAPSGGPVVEVSRATSGGTIIPPGRGSSPAKATACWPP
jgi:hypothetical protein